MKTREQVAEYINSGKCTEDAGNNKPHAFHFGLVELRLLMDFIYESEPEEDSEKIVEIG